jgi:hypothetical protein
MKRFKKQRMNLLQNLDSYFNWFFAVLITFYNIKTFEMVPVLLKNR